MRKKNSGQPFRPRKSAPELCLAYADYEGNIYDFPEIEPVFRTGNRFVRIDSSELVPLPFDSYMFRLPDRYPVFFNKANSDFNHIEVDVNGDLLNAVACHPASAWLRTYLPAYIKGEGSAPLPIWGYAPLVFRGDEFFTAALRIDDDPRSDPAIHLDPAALEGGIGQMTEKYPDNRLISQLKKCSTEYGCLCARNFFLARHEAPLPVSTACNAACAACLSLQPECTGVKASHGRITFSPEPLEIAQVMLQHFSAVPGGVASFGQGCEGEPLLEWARIATAVSMVREKTSAGTINVNTNGSMPEAVAKLIDSGIDSIRISMNSPTEKYYTAYHRPGNYSFADLLRSIDAALNRGIFVSINLFFMPGFTDSEKEVEALDSFLDRFPVNMIQTRNMNMDPDLYFEVTGFTDSEPFGIRKLVERLRSRKGLRLGYYNPPRESF